MVADNSLKTDNNDSSADISIIDFLWSNPRRAVIVDFLNVMISGEFGVRNITDLCEVLKVTYPGAPLIIVTKRVDGWYNVDADTAKAITRANPNILILICDTFQVKKKTSGLHDSDSLLAEADDNLISLLGRAMRLASVSIKSKYFPGCGPEVVSNDKYRNEKDVFETIPRYEYISYYLGEDTKHCIDQKTKFDWIYSIASATLVIRQKCFYMKWLRPCVKCGGKMLTCPECKICWVCNDKLRDELWWNISSKNNSGSSPDTQNPRDHLGNSA